MDVETRAADTDLPFQRLPYIDYAGHPLYAREGGRVARLDRLVGYARYLKMLGYVLGLRLYHLSQRRPWPDNAPTPHLDELRRNGFLQLRFSAEDRAAILAAAQPWFRRLEAHRAAIELGRRGYGDGQIDSRAHEAPELFAALQRAFEANGVLASVRAFLGCRAEIRKVTVQINDEWDTYWRKHFQDRGLPLPPTAFFHLDNTYGVVKVIMYVSEVTETSGPFSYVPGTNRLEFGLIEGLLLRTTDIWVDEWPQTHRQLLLTLPWPLRRKAKFGDDIPVDAGWGRWLLQHEHTLTSAGGDLLLFDTFGIHRGGMIQRGERRILQIMIR